MKNQAKPKPIFSVFTGNFLSHLKQFSSGFALPMIHPQKDMGNITLLIALSLKQKMLLKKILFNTVIVVNMIGKEEAK